MKEHSCISERVKVFRAKSYLYDTLVTRNSYIAIAEGYTSWRSRPWPIALVSLPGTILDLGADACINGVEPPTHIDSLARQLRALLKLHGLLVATIWSWRQPRFAAQTLLNMLKTVLGFLGYQRRYMARWKTRERARLF